MGWGAACVVAARSSGRRARYRFFGARPGGRSSEPSCAPKKGSVRAPRAACCNNARPEVLRGANRGQTGAPPTLRRGQTHHGRGEPCAPNFMRVPRAAPRAPRQSARRARRTMRAQAHAYSAGRAACQSARRAWCILRRALCKITLQVKPVHARRRSTGQACDDAPTCVVLGPVPCVACVVPMALHTVAWRTPHVGRDDVRAHAA